MLPLNAVMQQCWLLKFFFLIVLDKGGALIDEFP